MVHRFRAGHPLVFTHIPKTAGTALAVALGSAVRPQSPVQGFDRAALGPFRDIDALDRNVRRKLIASPTDLPGDADFVHGHIAPYTTRTRYPGGEHLTVLREPRVRVVSHWLFSRAHTDLMLRPMAGWAEYVKLAWQPLQPYLAMPDAAFYTDNLITRVLIWPSPLAPPDGFIKPEHDEEVYQQARASLFDFDFVGVAEDPNLVDAIGAWLQCEFTLPRLNESSVVRRAMACDVGEESERAADLLDERTRIDSRLWRDLALAAGVLGSPGTAQDAAQHIFRRAIDRYSRLPVLTRREEVLRAALSLAAGARRRLGARGR
jgi:hypothetical protein